MNKINLKTYFNGIEIPNTPVNPPNRLDKRTDSMCNDGLIIGSSTLDGSSPGVALNDIIIWNRTLFNEEAHRFIGYTSKYFFVIIGLKNKFYNNKQ